MKFHTTALLVSLAGLLSAAEPYANPALNPVKFEKPPLHAPLVLVKDGKLHFVIAYDTKAEKNIPSLRRSVEHAVKALADAFERTTGQRPETVDAASPEAAKAPVVIAVGKSVLTDKAGLDIRKLPREGFVVRTSGKMLIIAGHDGSMIPGSYQELDAPKYHINGTANGAYDFLERFLGMRWYFPGLGVVAPKIENLTLAPVSYSDAPKYFNRHNYAYALKFRGRENWPWPDVKNDNADFIRAWRLGFSTRRDNACHSPRPDFMAKAFPNKLDLIFYRDNTGYRYYNPAWHVGNFYNMCDPQFQQFLVDTWKKYYDSNGKETAPWRQDGKSWYPPNPEYIIFGQCDTRVSLENESNRHLFPKERKGDPIGQDSDLYAFVHSELARGIAKALPGKRMIVLAYHYYTRPPLKYRDLPDNLDIQVCAGRIVLSKSEAVQKSLKEIYSDWHDVLGKRKVTAWTYGSQFSAFTKALQGRYMRDFLKTVGPYLSEHGLMYDAGGLDWEYYYSYYPVYRSLWNPEFDIDAALDEHWEKLYGARAGAELKAFYRLLVDRWEKIYIPSIAQSQSQVHPNQLYQAFSIKTVDQLEEYLKNAVTATSPGSIERKRVEFFAKPWSKEFTAARTFLNLRIPVAEVKKLDSKDTIKIDGKLDDPVWKNTPEITLRDAKGGDQALPSRPVLKLLWNNEGIYLGFSAQGKVTVNPGDLWKKSDNFEFFLAPPTKDAYYHFALSPEKLFSGGMKVEKPVEGPYAKWNYPGVRYEVEVRQDGYTAELFIPFAGLNLTPPKAYSSYFMNFVNNKYQSEYSAWSLTMGNNHNHTLWGKIRFLGKGD